MRIIVCMKQGLDPKTVKISRSREELDMREAVHKTRFADKVALETALRVRESSDAGEVIALVVGDEAADDTAREAIAIGADRAALVLAPPNLGGKGMAALIAAAAERLGGADLLIAGQPDEMDRIGSIAPRLATALDLPLLMDVVGFDAHSGGLSAVARGDGGGLRMPVALPAVAEIHPSAGRPRYPLPSRIATAWEPGLVETWTADELGVSEEVLAPDTEVGGLVLGAERQRGQTISGSPSDAARELVAQLRGRFRGQRLI